MDIDNIYDQISKIEREIALLPEGSITKKRIKDKDYYYHRIMHDGKRLENYVSFEKVPELREATEKRKKLEKKLKELKRLLPREKRDDKSLNSKESNFKTTVRTGKQLDSC